jgi:hypothetical protein
MCRWEVKRCVDRKSSLIEGVWTYDVIAAVRVMGSRIRLGVNAKPRRKDRSLHRTKG